MLVIVLRITIPPISIFFFFNDTATTEIYTLSLHDALPIFQNHPDIRMAYHHDERGILVNPDVKDDFARVRQADRKSTRLNSSHQIISYAVFCLKKKKHGI